VTAQIPLVLVLAGVSSGALPILCGSLAAMLAFILALILPVLINLFFIEAYHLFDVMLVCYLVYLLVMAIKMHKTIRSSIAIQFKNTELVDNLSEAKHQLEIINKKLQQVATHDPLTNVPNRNLFSQYFEEALAHAKLQRKILAVLYMDIDGFKETNDTHGHHIGDQLLLIIVDRLDQLLDNPNAIARLGGDEFTVLLDNVVDPNEVAKIAGRICNTITQPMVIDHLEIKVSASIGIAIYPLDGDNAKALITVADKAMYHVKEHGGNGFRFNVTLPAD
jgi:diguanylate cyclase (GGDEF)-like protein